MSQYPGLSKENLQARFRKIDEENFARPTTENKAGYKKATEIYDKAKSEGTDLGKVAVDNGITHDSLIDGKSYNTLDTADLLRQDAMKTSHDLLRPALAEAELGVQKVPISEVRSRLLAEVDKIPKTQITDAERALMKKNIGSEYSDTSAAAKVHPDGYSLTDLHDAKIVTSGNAKYKPNGTNADNFSAKSSKTQSDAFRSLLEEKAPPELDIKNFNKELQKKFELADYLESLHTKKVPTNFVSNSIDFAGKILGAKVGAAGYHLGGVLFDSFERMPSPLKAYYLRSIEKTQPEIFKAFQSYIGDQETARLLRKQLPAPKTIFQGPTQAGQPYTPNPLFGTTPVVETKPIK